MHLKVCSAYVDDQKVPLRHVCLLFDLAPQLFRRDGREGKVRERLGWSGEGGVPGRLFGLLSHWSGAMR